MSDALYKPLEIGHEAILARAFEQRASKFDERAFVIRIRVCTTGLFLGLSRSPQHIVLDALGESFPTCIVRPLQRPSADQSLVQEILVISTGCRKIVHLTLFRAIPVAPSAEVTKPERRDFGKNVDAGSHIFGALRIVGGRCEHRVRPGRETLLIGAVELLGAGAEMTRIASNFVQ